MDKDISRKLDQLADFQAQKQYLELQKRELIDSVLPPEVKARLEEIEAEFAGRSEAVDLNIQALEAEIRSSLLNKQETVKGNFLAGIWCQGRVSWDTRSLDRYALSHPEVMRFRKQGEPYVSIRSLQ